MFCWIKSYKIFFFIFSQKKELIIWRKGKLSKNCPKIVKIDKVYKVTLHSFIIFNIFVFYCFFYFLTFLLINLGSKKGPYFWWAITQKRGKTHIFYFFIWKSKSNGRSYVTIEKILTMDSLLNFDLKTPLFFRFLDPWRPMVGSNPTFSFWVSRGAWGTHTYHKILSLNNPGGWYEPIKFSLL